jgi:Holliday junction resolvase-like predicted endonuclease
MKIEKSTRHSKITGDFAENLVLYWLSKHGFECARIDHTGIDLIARKKGSSKPFGISVKSRSRNEGKEGQYLHIPNDNFKKIDVACEAFGCEPYLALVIDEADIIRVYILSKDLLFHYHPMCETNVGWKMTKKWMETYAKDDRIIKFELKHKIIRWWDEY